jgi:nucleotide-binding universal stress UspA family protein
MFGLLLYYGYFEKQAASAKPQVLERPVPAGVRTEDAVVVPLHNPDHVGVLLDYAQPIAKSRNNALIAYSVVEVPRQLPIYEGLRFTQHREGLLNAAREHAATHNLSLDTDLVVAHHAADGILSGARRYGGDCLVMGWKGHTDTRDRIFGEVADQVIRHAPCDLVLLKIEGTEKPKRCLFPTAGGTHARLAAEMLNTLAPAFGMEVTVCYVVEPGATEETRRQAYAWIEKTLENLNIDIDVERKLIEATSIAGGIAKESRNYDLVVLGAAREPYLSQVMFGEIPEKVARFSPASVLVVKRYEGHVRSWLKRAFG